MEKRAVGSPNTKPTPPSGDNSISIPLSQLNNNNNNNSNWVRFEFWNAMLFRLQIIIIQSSKGVFLLIFIS
jgi:hypothetical protein